MTASRVKKAADKAAAAAQVVQEQAAALANNPDQIDSLILKLLVYALFLVPLHFFVENIGPYTTVLESVLAASNPLTEISGVIMVCLVQYCEVRPFTTALGTSVKVRKRRAYVALAAYITDVTVCAWAWPIFDTEFGLPGLDDIVWVNVGKIIAIVCGFSLWFALRRFVQRKA